MHAGGSCTGGGIHDPISPDTDCDGLQDGSETHNNDKIGRLTSTTGSSQWGALSWTHDNAGNRLTSNDPGCAANYTYPTNDNGQATLSAAAGCIPGATLDVTWTHDNNGRTTQGDEKQNNVLTYSYYWTNDKAGRLTHDQKYTYATQTTTVRGDYCYGPDGELLKSTAGFRKSPPHRPGLGPGLLERLAHDRAQCTHEPRRQIRTGHSLPRDSHF